jgi:hypothetical protein
VKSTIGERLLWRDGDFKLSQCAFCVHKTPLGATCAAFPNGIPLPILRNQADHRKGYYGDRKIRFQLAGDGDATYLATTGFAAVD